MVIIVIVIMSTCFPKVKIPGCIDRLQSSRDGSGRQNSQPSVMIDGDDGDDGDGNGSDGDGGDIDCGDCGDHSDDSDGAVEEDETRNKRLKNVNYSYN